VDAMLQILFHVTLSTLLLRGVAVVCGRSGFEPCHCPYALNRQLHAQVIYKAHHMSTFKACR